MDLLQKADPRKWMRCWKGTISHRPVSMQELGFPFRAGFCSKAHPSAFLALKHCAAGSEYSKVKWLDRASRILFLQYLKQRQVRYGSHRMKQHSCHHYSRYQGFMSAHHIKILQTSLAAA